jgi:hypothetical protein
MIYSKDIAPPITIKTRDEAYRVQIVQLPNTLLSRVERSTEDWHLRSVTINRMKQLSLSNDGFINGEMMVMFLPLLVQLEGLDIHKVLTRGWERGVSEMGHFWPGTRSAIMQLRDCLAEIMLARMQGTYELKLLQVKHGTTMRQSGVEYEIKQKPEKTWFTTVPEGYKVDTKYQDSSLPEDSQLVSLYTLEETNDEYNILNLLNTSGRIQSGTFACAFVYWVNNHEFVKSVSLSTDVPLAPPSERDANLLDSVWRDLRR